MTTEIVLHDGASDGGTTHAKNDATATKDLPRIEQIRAFTTELVEREDVTKQSALQVVKMFHDMENLLHDECAIRDKIVTDQSFEIERLRMQAAIPPPALPQADALRRKKW